MDVARLETQLPTPRLRRLLPLDVPLVVIPAAGEVSILFVRSHSESEGEWSLTTAFYYTVDNYMDYTDDACMTEFSTGQITRLRAQIALYRGIPA